MSYVRYPSGPRRVPKYIYLLRRKQNTGRPAVRKKISKGKHKRREIYSFVNTPDSFYITFSVSKCSVAFYVVKY